MTKLANQLELRKCPHCNVDKPLMMLCNRMITDAHSGGKSRVWKTYSCRTCGGAIVAAAMNDDVRSIRDVPLWRK